MKPGIKRLLWYVAVTCFVTWAAWAGVIALRMFGALHGAIPAWLGPDAPLELTLNALCMLAMLACWFGSIYVWARSRRRGVIHGAVLPALVFFGAAIGPIYILAALRSVPEVKPDEAAA